MSKDLAATRAAFRMLHEDGYVVIPNPCDIGGVRRLEKLGFKALASTSSGYAWSLGRQDGELTHDEVLEHLRTLCASIDLPVNANFEAGFADQPGDVAANVSLAVEAGVAGLSIEDRTGQDLYPCRSRSRVHRRHGKPSASPAKTFCSLAARRAC